MSMSPCWNAETLDDFVDGELPEDERRRVERHLETCETCRREVADRRRLARAVSELPRELSPSRDLWDDIAGRLETGDDAVDPVAAPRRSRAGVAGFGWAVAAVLVVSVAVVVYGLLIPKPAGRSSAGLSTTEVAALGGGQLLAPYRHADEQLTELASGLEQDYRARRADLSPKTRTVIQRNLAIIDEAIRLSREALERDATDYQAGAMLRDMHRRKIELLELAKELPQEL
jgi:hypothetical protein